MKVSWIDPDSFRSLAESLLDPEVHKTPSEDAQTATPIPHTAPEISTAEAPKEDFSTEPSFPIASQTKSISTDESPLPELSEEDEEPSLAPSPIPELDQIRKHLQSIRDRAKASGVITPKESSEEIEPPPDEPSTPLSSDAAFKLAELPEYVAPQASTPEQDSPSLPLPEIPTDQKEAPQETPQSTSEVEPPTPPAIPDLDHEASNESDPPEEEDPLLFTPGTGSLAERLDTFIEWATKITGAQDLVLVDDHGDLLWGKATHTDLLASTMLALNSHWRNNPTELMQRNPMLNSPLGGNRILSILPTTSRFGQVTLALVLNSHLEETYAQTLGEALRWTIDGEKS